MYWQIVTVAHTDTVQQYEEHIANAATLVVQNGNGRIHCRIVVDDESQHFVFTSTELSVMNAQALVVAAQDMVQEAMDFKQLPMFHG